MIGVIGGTGLNEFLAGEKQQMETPYGLPSAAIVSSKFNNTEVLFLARHGTPHTIPPHRINYRANLWALKALGASQILAVNAVGGITPGMQAGQLVIPDQIIDYSWGREHSYFDGDIIEGGLSGLEHIDFTYPFAETLRQLLIKGGDTASIPLIDKAVYGVVQGPRLETAAEILRMERDGCDLVGMTAMPEAALARELEMEYASLCLVVNPAAGKSDQLITMEDIHQVLAEGIGRVKTLLQASFSLR